MKKPLTTEVGGGMWCAHKFNEEELESESVGGMTRGVEESKDTKREAEEKLCFIVSNILPPFFAQLLLSQANKTFLIESNVMKLPHESIKTF